MRQGNLPHFLRFTSPLGETLRDGGGRNPSVGAASPERGAVSATALTEGFCVYPLGLFAYPLLQGGL